MIASKPIHIQHAIQAEAGKTYNFIVEPGRFERTDDARARELVATIRPLIAIPGTLRELPRSDH